MAHVAGHVCSAEASPGINDPHIFVLAGGLSGLVRSSTNRGMGAKKGAQSPSRRRLLAIAHLRSRGTGVSGVRVAAGKNAAK